MQRGRQRPSEHAGHRAKLIGGRPRGGDITAGEGDLDVAGSQSRAGHWVTGLVIGPPDGGGGRLDLSRGQAQQREPGLRIATEFAGQLELGLGGAVLATEPVQVALQVGGGAPRPLPHRIGQAAVSLLDLIGCGVPVAAKVQHLGAMDQALTSVQHELWLAVDPAAQRGGPRVGAADVEQFGAALDGGAVGIANRDRRDVVGLDGDHPLVEQGDPLVHSVEPDQAPAFADPCQRCEFGVVEEDADLGRRMKRLVPGAHVAGERCTQRGRVTQVTAFDAVDLAVVQQPLGAVDPTASARQVAARSTARTPARRRNGPPVQRRRRGRTSRAR